MLIFCSFLHIISSFMPLNKLIKGASRKAFRKVLETERKKKEKGVSCKRISYLSLQICRWCIKSSPFACPSHCTWRILCVCSCSLLAGLQQHLKISSKISLLLCSVLHLCAGKACPHPWRICTWVCTPVGSDVHGLVLNCDNGDMETPFRWMTC